MDPAELFTRVAVLPLGAAAAVIARSGVPVFPCLPGGKRPLTRHGFMDATTDTGQVAAWWRHWPEANIAMPTGAASGVEVVDIDVKPGGSGFGGFARARTAGLVGGHLAVVRTPSGGAHVYFPTSPGRAQRSWQAAQARVDFRGDGGYVIIPPSTTITDATSTAGYRLADGPVGVPAPIDAAALRAMLDPRPAPHRRPSRGRVGPEQAGRLAAWVATRTEGERNRGLFWASCRLAEAGCDIPEVMGTLGPAAEQAGLSPREATATIRSAYRTTRVQPAPSAASRTDLAATPAYRGQPRPWVLS